MTVHDVIVEMQRYLKEGCVVLPGSLHTWIAALEQAESGHTAHNSAMVPCNQYMKQSSTVSVCPIGHFNCGASPCMVAQHQ